MRNSQRLPDKNQKPDLPFLINKIMPAVVLAVLSQKMFSAVSNAIWKILKKIWIFSGQCQYFLLKCHLDNKGLGRIHTPLLPVPRRGLFLNQVFTKAKSGYSWVGFLWVCRIIVKDTKWGLTSTGLGNLIVSSLRTQPCFRLAGCVWYRKLLFENLLSVAGRTGYHLPSSLLLTQSCSFFLNPSQ